MTPAQIELRAATLAAHAACDAFSAACTAAGFKSRWDYDPRRHHAPAVEAARQAHYAAGERAHKAWEARRAEERDAA